MDIYVLVICYFVIGLLLGAIANVKLGLYDRTFNDSPSDMFAIGGIFFVAWPLLLAAYVLIVLFTLSAWVVSKVLSITGR